jgi:hypothetical protein
MSSKSSNPASRPSLSRSPGSKRGRLEQLRRLTLRDRQLLAWLAEHYVLSTSQITQALFPSARSARLRLAALHAIDAVHRFVDVTTGDHQHLYTLGPLGMLVHPTTYTDPQRADARPPRSSIERTERIIGSPRLRHLLGTNQLFVDLLAYARTDAGAHLARWWSEQHATAAYALAQIRPDGHAIWQAGGRTIGFFLEHDNGTEPLATVLRKLRGYERLAEFGPRYPVLLHVPTRRREANLIDALAGLPTVMPVATGLHGEHPAGPAWTLTADPGTRRWLHELPSDHGPSNTATNPHRYTADDDNR